MEIYTKDYMQTVSQVASDNTIGQTAAILKDCLKMV